MGTPKFEETYEKDHYSPGTQEKIKRVLKQSKDDESGYGENSITKDSTDNEIHTDAKQIGILRRVMCKNCDFEGVLEAPDTSHYPETSIFKFLDKDNEGYMHLECPSCKTHISYASHEFLGLKFDKKRHRLIYVMIALMLILTIWMTIR